MAIKDDWLSCIPQQFQDKRKLEVLIGAFSDELQEVYDMFEQLKTMRGLDTATGQQLDNIGDIVVLSRAQSALYAGVLDFDVIDDERYRLFLKYKALRNANLCTFSELVAACRLLYNSEIVYYREDKNYPATFFLNIGAKFSNEILGLLQSSDLTIRPAGVTANISYFNMEFFGFSDMNRLALGFGQGPFAQSIIQEPQEPGGEV